MRFQGFSQSWIYLDICFFGIRMVLFQTEIIFTRRLSTSRINYAFRTLGDNSGIVSNAIFCKKSLIEKV